MGNCYKSPDHNDLQTELKNGTNTKHNINSSTEDTNNPNTYFISEALQAHNKYRKLHGIEPLSINIDLCDYSQQFANFLASNNVFEHSNCLWDGKLVGENIAMCTGQDISGQLLTDMWYNEIKDYDFDFPGFTGGTGHFTQVIWKDSKDLGIGIACSSEGTYYVVANYYPAGNNINTFQSNVFRSCN